MKKGLPMLFMVLVFALAIGGCATKGDLERVETQEKLIGAKADQAAQDAQAAKAAADAATLKANEAAARAEEAVKRAEEREDFHKWGQRPIKNIIRHQAKQIVELHKE